MEYSYFMNRFVLGALLVIAGIVLIGSAFLFRSDSTPNSVLPNQSVNRDVEEVDDKTLPTPATTDSVSMYAEYKNKQCATDDECGKLNCLDGQCLVQRCQDDSDCPAGLWCGKGLHPAPGMCHKSPGAL